MIDTGTRARERASLYRASDARFAEWAAGHGVIEHSERTQVRIGQMAEVLCRRESGPDRDQLLRVLTAADRLTNAAMWLVVHMTYARRVDPDGAPLEAGDFKDPPEGHTGGALNMVPAYVGYLAANALSGQTRGWIMGQGHCVAAIDAVNLLVDNMSPAHAARYALSGEGLTRFVQDFYSYALREGGELESPLGSHVNVHTAGGVSEGGYLGFAELQYVHMPLRGERLVAFLSDGAFEEQRGSDWAPRWWRAEDSGLVAPIMIANGRRIDQRTTMSQQGGVEWFRDHLRLNGFDPLDLDGRDPASIAWGILEAEERLLEAAHDIERGASRYPVALPYGIAETIKGWGFPGAGTNRAHNLPLPASPARDAEARASFNEGAGRLFVSLPELREARELLANHAAAGRPPERDHPLAARTLPAISLPEPPWRPLQADGQGSPMRGVDAYFCQILEANPDLRPRVGNPDEMRSNRLDGTLDRLHHRVTAPEAGGAEAIDGAVITALNEEAVVSAALANKSGINLVATYEAFAMKMLGCVRQELIFSRSQLEAGRSPGWLSVPIMLTSHTWENGKNEQSHQDPTFCEALLSEMSDVSRVAFPPDHNAAIATLRAVYQSEGCVWSLVVPKQPARDRLTPEQARRLVADGAIRLRGEGSPDETLALVAVGAYQLDQLLRASDRLLERQVPHSVVYLLEPGRFREPRDARETALQASAETIAAVLPASTERRVFLSHTRPESLLGAVRPLDTGPGKTRALGYINRGGTLDAEGLLFRNRATWAHALRAAAEVLERDPASLLEPDELAALEGSGPPYAVISRPRTA